jgi:hypothetical protein
VLSQLQLFDYCKQVNITVPFTDGTGDGLQAVFIDGWMVIDGNIYTTILNQPPLSLVVAPPSLSNDNNLHLPLEYNGLSSQLSFPVCCCCSTRGIRGTASIEYALWAIFLVILCFDLPFQIHAHAHAHRYRCQ